MRSVLKALVLPPTSCLILLVVGFFCLRRRPKLARALLALGIVSLWVASTPWVAAGLYAGLQGPPLDLGAARGRADAVVILSADTQRAAPDLGGQSTVAALALQRLRYGAIVHRATDAPILCSGGTVGEEKRTHAEIMRDVLVAELGVPVRWVETKSTNTAGNARETAEVLREAGVERVFLVTHAWHMPRAQWCFERVGLEVVPAPTAYYLPPTAWYRGWLPQWGALRDTTLALHEWLGQLVYRITE